MEGLAPTLGSLAHWRAQRGDVVGKFATFPRPSLPNAATTGAAAAEPQREREGGRYRMTQPNKSAVGPAWERKMPIRTERAREEQLGSQLRITCLPTGSCRDSFSTYHKENAGRYEQTTPSNYFHLSHTCGSSAARLSFI